jgi:hypothetical protein
MARTAARALAPTLGAAPGVGARIATALAEKPAEQAMMAMGGALAGQQAAAASREAGIEQTPESIERARLVGEVAGALGTGALMRRVPGVGAVVTPAAVSAERAAQQRAIAAGQAAEIPVMTTDVIPPRTFSAKMARGLGEKIPFTGTGATRRAQQEARVAAVDNFLREQGAIDDESFTLMSDIAADLQKTRGVKLSSLLEKKRSVIEQSGASDIPVDVSGAQKAIKSKLKQLEILTGPEYRETERMLSEFSEKLSNKTPFQIEKQKQALGMTLERSDLENIRTEAKKVLSGVYSSLNKDIENHIAKNAGPEALAKYQSAQKVLAPMAQDLKDFAELSMALNQGDKRMGAVINMMNNTDPKVAKKLYDNLSAQGQATMRAAVVTDVANKAGGLENLSPEKFLTQVKAKAKQLSVVMDKEDMTRLRNLQRALKVTANASQAALAPPTGVQSVPFLAGGGLVAALGTSGAAAVGFGAGALARAFESAPVRDLLMKMPTVKPGSRAETELAREIAVAMELAMRENEPVSTGR